MLKEKVPVLENAPLDSEWDFIEAREVNGQQYRIYENAKTKSRIAISITPTGESMLRPS